MRYITAVSIGILICLGIIFKDDIQSYWKKEPQVAAPVIANSKVPTLIESVEKPAPQKASPVIESLKLKPIGTIQQLTGTAAARDINGNIRTLTLNTPVFEGDMLETATGAFIQAVLDDGEQLFVKPKTQLIIEEFFQDPQDQGHTSVKRLLRGKLRIISGLIGKSGRDVYQMKTHVSTIGIRGTEYGIALCIEKECQHAEGIMDSGLHISVIEGQIESHSHHGKLLVDAGHTYHQPHARAEPVKVSAVAGAVFDHHELQRLPDIKIKKNRLIDRAGDEVQNRLEGVRTKGASYE